MRFIKQNLKITKSLARYKNSRALPNMIAAAMTATNNKEWELAIELWDNIWAIHPRPMPAKFYVRATRCRRQLGDYGKAEALVAEGLKYFSEDTELFMEQAEISTANKKWRKASVQWSLLKNMFQTYERKFPLQAYKQLCGSLRGNLEFREALKVAREGLKIYADNQVLLLEEARALSGLCMWPQARACWETLVTTVQTNESYVGLVTAQLKCKQTKKALKTLQIALIHFPNDTKLKLHEAKINTDLNIWNKAKVLWEKLINDHSNDLELWEIQQARFNLSYVKRFINIDSYRDRIRLRSSKQQRKFVVYTSVSKGYDQLKLPEVINDNFDYVIFTDDKFLNGSGVFNVRPFPKPYKDPRISIRYPKSHAHVLFKEYEAAIWVDTSLMVVGDISGLVTKFVNSGYAIGSGVHPERKNIQEELLACIAAKKEKEEPMRQQVARYLSEGFTQNELSENTMLMFRPNHPNTKPSMETWWHEIITESKRDQLSFNYSLWKNKTKWFKLTKPPHDIRHHKDIVILPHHTKFEIIDKFEKEL